MTKTTINSKIDKINKAIKYTDIKGKAYAEVHERVKGFRQEFPDWVIDTNIVIELSDPNQITMKTIILDKKGNTRATGHAMEVKGDGFINKTSHVENCETSAIGRALGNLGIGIEQAFASADEVKNAVNKQEETKYIDDEIEVLRLWAKIKESKDDSATKNKRYKELEAKCSADMKVFLKATANGGKK